METQSSLCRTCRVRRFRRSVSRCNLTPRRRDPVRLRRVRRCHARQWPWFLTWRSPSRCASTCRHCHSWLLVVPLGYLYLWTAVRQHVVDVHTLLWVGPLVALCCSQHYRLCSFSAASLKQARACRLVSRLVGSTPSWMQESLFPSFQRDLGSIRRFIRLGESFFPSFRRDSGTIHQSMDCRESSFPPSGETPEPYDMTPDRGKDAFPSSNEAPDRYGETPDRGKGAFPASEETPEPHNEPPEGGKDSFPPSKKLRSATEKHRIGGKKLSLLPERRRNLTAGRRMRERGFPSFPKDDLASPASSTAATVRLPIPPSSPSQGRGRVRRRSFFFPSGGCDDESAESRASCPGRYVCDVRGFHGARHGPAAGLLEGRDEGHSRFGTSTC